MDHTCKTCGKTELPWNWPAPNLCRECDRKEPVDSALKILIDISESYLRLCDVMLTLDERKAELEEAGKLMTAMERLCDEIFKRKSPNDQALPRRAGDVNREAD